MCILQLLVGCIECSAGPSAAPLLLPQKTCDIVVIFRAYANIGDVLVRLVTVLLPKAFHRWMSVPTSSQTLA